MDRRLALFAMLGAGRPDSEIAASELLLHPNWLVGPTPSQLLVSLKGLDYDSKSAVFRLAREWESSCISEALVEHFHNESDEQTSEHIAWLIKHVAGRTQLKAIVNIVLSANESSCVRRLCIEALDRLCFARLIGWHDTQEIIHALKNDADVNIREGIAGLVGALPDNTEKFSILMEMLSDSSDFVAGSAANAISQMNKVHVDRLSVERFSNHQSLLIRDRVRDIFDR
jgi:3-methyladenine DNA glycosylase AlkC